MKMLPWLPALAACCASALWAQQTPPDATLVVPFTSRIAVPDLTIERITVVQSGDQLRFTVKYTTGSLRHLSLFDPPRGDNLKVVVRGALTPPAGEAVVSAPATAARQAAALTMRLFGDARDEPANFVTLGLSDPALRPIFGDRARTASAPRQRGGVLTEVAEHADIRWKDVTRVSGLTAEKIAGLTFNDATRWSERDAAVSREILLRGMEPGLGIRALHRAGIDGTGVSVGIIDQNMFAGHPEYKDRIARYHDVGCNASAGSMHGPAVASLLVGKNIGTAPGARLYFVAAPSWTKDAKFQADALHWLLDLNATLPPAEKLKVISVSAAPSGEGSPFNKNGTLWDAACARAESQGVLVLDCTAHRGMVGAAAYDPAAPDDLSRIHTVFQGNNPALRARRVFAPMRSRTVAEEYAPNECSYQYDGNGGLSWAVPYTAGVLALAWQVSPDLTATQMAELLRSTAYEKDGVRFIHPAALVAGAKAAARPRQAE